MTVINEPITVKKKRRDQKRIGAHEVDVPPLPETKPRKKRGGPSSLSRPIIALSSPPENEPEDHTFSASQKQPVLGSEQNKLEGTVNANTPQIEGVSSNLVIYQSERETTVRQKNRLVLARGAIVRRGMGWYPPPILPENPTKEQKKEVAEVEKKNKVIRARATSFIKRVANGLPPDIEDLEFMHLVDIVKAFTLSAAPLEDYISKLEKKQNKEFQKLPVAAWVDSVPGFGIPGAARIVGEAKGDLGLFRSPAALWKRLGLHTYNGKAARKTTDKYDAMKMGYNPRRRSVVWQSGHWLCANNATKREDGTKENGPYREAYLKRKEYEKARNPEISKGWADKRAQRYVEKKLIKDFWKAWRRTMKLGAKPLLRLPRLPCP
jgi:hypothetical protein